MPLKPVSSFVVPVVEVKPEPVIEVTVQPVVSKTGEVLLQSYNLSFRTPDGKVSSPVQFEIQKSYNKGGYHLRFWIAEKDAEVESICENALFTYPIDKIGNV